MSQIVSKESLSALAVVAFEEVSKGESAVARN